MKKNSKKIMELVKWVWSFYIKSTLFPLLVICCLFIAVNISVQTNTVKSTTNTLRIQLQEEFQKTTKQDTQNINEQLKNINYITEMYANQTKLALETETSINSEDEQRLAYSDDGIYYTTKDTEQGGAAIFYSGYYPINESERDKVARVLETQYLMKDIQLEHPLAASIYLNTFDSLNIIYPYFDVLSQYPGGIDIPKYNFYYEADEEHNPDRGVEWTDVYLDPAGHGWMASCIAPVYNGDFLEGVVGIDVTVSNIIEQVLNLDIAWDGYAMLLGNDGTILALPECGEKDWGISELTEHHYAQAIYQDTYKPIEFNIENWEELSSFVSEMKHYKSGFSNIQLNGQQKVAAWDTVGATGWKLMFIVPESEIYAGVNKIEQAERNNYIMILLGLLAFSILFMFILFQRSKALSRNILSPLLTINEMTKLIGQGEYSQKTQDFGVVEFNETSDCIVNMGNQLGKINKDLLDTQGALEERELYLQTLVDSIEDIILEIDEDGIIKTVRKNNDIDFSPRLVEAIRTNNASVFDILNENEAKNALEILKRVIDTDKSEELEYEINTSQGPRWFQTRIAQLGKNYHTVVVSARDITERKEMEHSIIEARNEAEKASRAKSQFLSNMSHELRTPLNAVIGFAQVLEIDPENPLKKPQQECVNEISKAGNHLLELINEVLDLAKIESGRITMSIEAVSVMRVVEETMALIKPMAEKYDIELSVDLCHCDTYIEADMIRMKQVLINLMNNAIKYNKEKGTAKFYCDSHEGFVRFHIVDDGMGIPVDEQEEIFKPFSRLNSTKDLVEGTGIGLAMVKKLIELMGGSVHVKSEVGKGSHFFVCVPKISSEKIESRYDFEKLTNIEPVNDGKKKYKVLYIEDNPANLHLVQRVMSYIPNIELLSSTQSQAGIDIAISHKPDLILLDINLPDMDGHEVFKRLQSYDETKEIPVIAVSANAMEKDIKKTLKMGFADYFVKPIDVPVFVEKLKRFFSKR